MTSVELLHAPLMARVKHLLDAAEAKDGARALSEHSELALRAADSGTTGPAHDPTDPSVPTSPAVRHLGVVDGDVLLAYAQLELPEPDGPVAVEGVVHPEHRLAGLGTALRSAVVREAAGRAVLAWAHGDHPGAAALAVGSGARRVRELLQMRRTLDGDLTEAVLPEGIRLRSFRPDEDDDAWLALNARAFASHPEQGTWTNADLDARRHEPWFDPRGFLLAEDERSGDLLGFHWTKVHAATARAEAVGEVYVIGVDPAAQGRRLGEALTLAGLRHLAGRGVDAVVLFVESDNVPGLRIYRRLGFEVARVDVRYALP